MKLSEIIEIIKNNQNLKSIAYSKNELRFTVSIFGIRSSRRSSEIYKTDIDFIVTFLMGKAISFISVPNNNQFMFQFVEDLINNQTTIDFDIKGV